jgi:hypothetical protein
MSLYTATRMAPCWFAQAWGESRQVMATGPTVKTDFLKVPVGFKQSCPIEGAWGTRSSRYIDSDIVWERWLAVLGRFSTGKVRVPVENDSWTILDWEGPSLSRERFLDDSRPGRSESGTSPQMARCWPLASPPNLSSLGLQRKLDRGLEALATHWRAVGAVMLRGPRKPTQKINQRAPSFHPQCIARSGKPTRCEKHKA